MGFTPKRTVYVLDFADTALDGLTVRMGTASIGEFLSLGELSDVIEDSTNVAEQVAAMGAALKLAANALISWDLERDGEPVATDLDGLSSMEPAHAMLLVNAWQRAVGDVDRPLERGSTDGSPSAEPLPPMEPLSASPAA